ncbi:MAG: hypothetical protein ABFD96_03335 [Armatimonadia bacterium]
MCNLWREVEDAEPERPIPPGADETGGELSEEEFEWVLEAQRRETVKPTLVWADAPDEELGLD